MQYSGGKARIARELGDVVRRLGARRRIYLEPFVGGGFMFEQVAPHFEVAIAADANPELVLLWRAVADGWEPPKTITEDRYRELRHADPSPERTFAGFGMSYSGKWWGGYCRNARGDDFCGAAARGIERKRKAFESATAIIEGDYRGLRPLIGPDTVTYCDPPYDGTTGYAGAPPWDAEAFWATAESWSRAGALVLVSEYQAPPGWVAVWCKERRMSMRDAAGEQRKVVENLYVHQMALEATQ